MLQTGGSDSGLGSVLSPFLTVQKAITVCEAAYDDVSRIVHVSSGNFTEDLNFTKPRISIIGEGTSITPSVGTSITGTVQIGLLSLTIGNLDMDYNNIYFDGFLFNGTITDSTVAVAHRLFITNCSLYAVSTCLNINNNISGTEYRCFVDNCTIQNSNVLASTSVMGFYGIGISSITNCKITSKGETQTAVYFGELSKTDTFARNIITSDSTSTFANPIMELHGLGIKYSIANCSFIYSSDALKTNAIYHSSGIYLGVVCKLVIVQCFFSLLGLSLGQNAIEGVSGASVVFGNNISASSTDVQSASTISANLTKYPMTPVV
jgi:hypothetical protein